MGFSGTWHIYEMEMWDEDYFNMEVQAYVKNRRTTAQGASLSTPEISGLTKI